MPLTSSCTARSTCTATPALPRCPDASTLASDLGQVGNPLPVEVYQRILPQLLDSGIAEKHLRMMIADNPARLIGLDD